MHWFDHFYWVPILFTYMQNSNGMTEFPLLFSLNKIFLINGEEILHQNIYVPD